MLVKLASVLLCRGRLCRWRLCRSRLLLRLRLRLVLLLQWPNKGWRKAHLAFLILHRR